MAHIHPRNQAPSTLALKSQASEERHREAGEAAQKISNLRRRDSCHNSHRTSACFQLAFRSPDKT